MFKHTAGLLSIAPLAFAQLNKLAQGDGKVYFGSATDNPELTDMRKANPSSHSRIESETHSRFPAYVAILSNFSEFGQITPGNSMKWVCTLTCLIRPDLTWSSINRTPLSQVRSCDKPGD